MTRHLGHGLLGFADSGSHCTLLSLQRTHVHGSGIARQALQQALKESMQHQHGEYFKVCLRNLKVRDQYKM